MNIVWKAAAFIFFPFAAYSTFLDLETHSSSYIEALIKIEIPDHPNAFNPSIIRWQGKLLLSFREVNHAAIPYLPCAGNSSLYLVWLDDDFSPNGPAFPVCTNYTPCRAEDARLLAVGNELYLIYSDNVDEYITEGGFRMWTAKVACEETGFFLYDQQRLSYFDGEDPLRREKNWVPFNYEGYLCLSYSLKPHRVLFPLEGSGQCATLADTPCPAEWKWGELRGGTPALDTGECYLGIFHSSITLSSVHSQGTPCSHYFIGAYTFSKTPPFQITRISPRPMIARGFYSGQTYEPYWKPVCVVFPCGLLIENNTLWITYGRQDHEMWAAKLDKEKLLQSLVIIDY